VDAVEGDHGQGGDHQQKYDERGDRRAHPTKYRHVGAAADAVSARRPRSGGQGRKSFLNWRRAPEYSTSRTL
jgi:hypothetical protein